jgi:pyridoxamine 5'-phosphate oxidase
MTMELIDPISLVKQWLIEGQETESSVPESMSVATVDEFNRPSIRLVLLRGLDEKGFVFYTNLASSKAAAINGNRNVALGFHWKSLSRQIRVQGNASIVSNDEADKYFASRERGSQIGAWASRQSDVLENSKILEEEVTRYTKRFGAAPIPRPEFWSGYRVSPANIEFWEEGESRLHKRHYYWKDQGVWKAHLLYP